MTNQTSGTMHELNIGELDQAALDAVTGGFFFAFFVRQSQGQNDPAARFQHVLNQISQGQG